MCLRIHVPTEVPLFQFNDFFIDSRAYLAKYLNFKYGGWLKLNSSYLMLKVMQVTFALAIRIQFKKLQALKMIVLSNESVH